MSLTSSKKIYLDFYNNSYQTINAKQLDSYSRHLNVVCTDYGKKVYLNPETMSAFIRYKKSDGYNVLNEVQIMDDGSLLVAITQQMLASEGLCKFDILIINATGLNVDSLEDVESFHDLGVSVLSTMCFFVNANATAIEHPEVVSSYEYDALITGLSKSVATENHMKELDEALNEAEEIRKSNEDLRISSEAARTTAETQRESSFNSSIAEWNKQVGDTIKDCTSEVANAVTQCETATDNANTATTQANAATTQCETATDNANIATANATEKIAEINKIIDSFSNTTIDFSEAEIRENIESGETLSILFGKIKKWFTDIELSHAEEVTSDDINQIINT